MNKFYICSSVGAGTSILNSFDNALFNSGIANYNLLKVSSILPPYCAREKVVDMAEGSLLYTAYASKCTREKDEIISAAIAVGLPDDSEKIGVIMEFSGNCSMDKAKNKVSAMVVEAMKNRRIKIKELLCEGTEVIGNGYEYVTAFAALAMWESTERIVLD